MPAVVLNVVPEDLDTAEKRGKYTVCIVGSGRLGIFQACLFADAGYRVICWDADQVVVNSLSKGKAAFLTPETEAKLRQHVKADRIGVTNDVKTAVSQSDIIVVTTPVKLDNKKKPNYSDLEGACRKVGPSLHCGSVVVITSTTNLDVTETLIKELLENTSGFKVGTDIGLAYSPIHVADGQTLQSVVKNERLVAAADKKSLEAASTVIQSLSEKSVKKTGNMKMAEASALFQALRRIVNLAVANELAVFCEKARIDYPETSRLLDTGANAQVSAPSLADGASQTLTHLLLGDAENLGAKLRTLQTATEVNREIPAHTLTLAKDALRICGRTPRRAKISLLGISETPNIETPPKTAAIEVLEILTSRGARVSVYDPYSTLDELEEKRDLFKRNLNEALEGADCLIILTGHDQFRNLNLKKAKIMMRKPAAIIDLEGILEPDKVEKEGFIYRGLGRGVWTR